MSTKASDRRRSSAGAGQLDEETGSTTPVGSRTGLDRRKGDTESGGHGRTAARKQAWYIRWIKGWGSGMRNDIIHRLPYYASDWTDAWNYRVVPATWVCYSESIISASALLHESEI